MTDIVDVSITMSVHLGDWMRETAILSTTEKGAHFSLLAAAWSRGGHLPADPPRLRRLAGVESADWPAVWSALSELWTKSEDGTTVHHAPTLNQIARARTAKAQAIARGKASQAARRPTPDPTPAKPEQAARRPTPDPTPAKPEQAADGLETVSKGSEDCLEPPTPTPTPTPTPDLPPPPPPPEDLNIGDLPKDDHCPAGGPAGPGGGGGDVPVLPLVLVPPEPEATKARKAKPDSANAVYAVYKHYWSHGRPRREPLRTSKTWRAIAARLKDGWTIEELCKAVDGYFLSPHHQGQNDTGTRYLDLELFMRSEEKVQKGIDFAEHPPKPGNRPAHDIRVGRVGAEECIHPDETGEVAL